MKIQLFSRRARTTLFGATMLGLFVGLTGCGGGGGGGGGPKSQSTVVITPTTNTPGQNASCSTSYTPNYVSDVTLLHWTSFPLRVFFTQDSNYTAARQAIAVAGFNEWVQSTQGGATYTVVNSANQANVTVGFYTFTGGPGDTLGTTVVSYYDDSKTIQSATVSLGFTGNNRNDILTSAHEYGHTLGIYGHSRSSADLMYFEGNDNGCGCITPADLNTVLTAYCGNFPHNANSLTAPHSGTLKTVTIN